VKSKRYTSVTYLFRLSNQGAVEKLWIFFAESFSSFLKFASDTLSCNKSAPTGAMFNFELRKAKLLEIFSLLFSHAYKFLSLPHSFRIPPFSKMKIVLFIRFSVNYREKAQKASI